jgi:bacterioferritin-associated ferredoxin
MYVCICNAITDTQIREAAKSGVRNLWELQKELGVASNCGKCKETAAEILSECKSNHDLSINTTKNASSV